MRKFNIKCKFCGNEEQDKFQTTIKDWDGYSEYTVLEEGCVEFKCLKCGTFGSTDKYKGGSNNKIDMFHITCNNCGSSNWSYINSLYKNKIFKPHIKCDKCGEKEEQE